MEQNMARILGGLHCFASVGKHLSFAKAAEELFITPSAVSHRIRHLEGQLGFPLFHRFTRRIAFTTEGRSLYEALRFSLLDLEGEIHSLRNNEAHGSLFLSCAPSFGGALLLPLLPRFERKYPGITLHLRCRNDLVDFETENVDLAIYYGQGSHPNLHLLRLMEETLTPVCSPAYASKHGLFGAPHKLGQCLLLHDAQPWAGAQYFSEWGVWLDNAEGAEVAGVDPRTGYSFDRSELAIEAARHGLGVAVGRLGIIGARMEAGELVAPFAQLVPSPQAYYLACTRERADSPMIVRFRDWMVEEIAAITAIQS